MSQLAFTFESLPPRFDGVDIRPVDAIRLGGQLKRVQELMSDHEWRTLDEICEAIGGTSEAGCSSRLRDLRKARFGGHKVERRRVKESAIFEYRIAGK